MGKHRCICQTTFCEEDGGDATIRMPKDAGKFKSWCNALFGRDDLPVPKSDPRISAAHFPPGSLAADVKSKSLTGEAVGINVKEGALPSQTNEEMLKASRGALARSLKLEALNDRHRRALLAGAQEEARLKDKSRDLGLRISLLESELKEAVDKQRAHGRSSQPADVGIDHNILRRKTPTEVRCLAGVPTHEALLKLYEFANADGAAENMVFFDQRERAGVSAGGNSQRVKTFRGVNGLFFTLMVLRTAMPLVVASTLFGVHESTGGRAFTTWLNFLYRSLRPVIRLPSAKEVVDLLPKNFEDLGYENCALVLDATEIEIPKSWQTNMNFVSFSTYKGRHTAKVLVAITPGGAICYIGPAYPGRMSDVEVVRKSGLVDAMRENGLSNMGFKVMADKGFNSISPLLIREGIHYCAPPFKVNGEIQFTKADMQQNWEVANLRIHVERAIGAMKKWSIVDSKFHHKQLDHLEMCFHVVAALVNLMQQPFRS